MQARSMEKRYDEARARGSVIAQSIYEFMNFNSLRAIGTNWTDMADGQASLTDDDADDIVAILTDVNCAKNFSIDLMMGTVSTLTIAKLASALATGRTKEGLAYRFNLLNLSGEKCQLLASGLASGNLPKNYTLGLHDCYLQDADIIMLADAIRSGLLSAGMQLEIDTSRHLIQNETWKNLFTAIAEGHAKAEAIGRTYNHFSLSLLSAVNAELIPFFIDELASGNYPEGMRLDLSGNKFSREDVLKFADPAKLQRYPQSFCIGFDIFRTEATIAFEQAIQQCNRWDIVYQLGGILKSPGVAAMVNRIHSGACKPGTKFDLYNAQLDDDCAELLASAITHKNCPDDLTFILGLNKITERGCKALIHACKTGGPKNLTLNFDPGGRFNQEVMQVLAGALKSKTFIQGLNLIFAIHAPLDTNGNIQREFLDVILDQCPPGLQIHIHGCLLASELESIVERMLRQTTLCKLEFNSYLWFDVFSPVVGDPETCHMNTARLELCCQRNKLMYDHPQLARQIKKIAAEYGMYQPGSASSSPVLTSAIFNAEGGKLPEDVVLWQRRLEEFKAKYSARAELQQTMRH